MDQDLTNQIIRQNRKDKILDSKFKKLENDLGQALIMLQELSEKLDRIEKPKAVSTRKTAE